MARTAPTAARSARASLSAEAITAEALSLIDEVGLEGFSFRKLAARLGCEAMSIYHYFPSKSHLFDALVDICHSETPIPPRDLGPVERMRQFCLGYRQTALRHPGFARYFLVHRQNHRGGLSWLEEIMDMLEQTGLPMATRATLFRCIGYYIMGAALDEASGYAAGPSAADPVPAEDARRDFPRIMEMGAQFSPANRLPMFEAGLEVMLNWLQAEMDRHAAGTD